jgi:hypothetical protein
MPTSGPECNSIPGNTSGQSTVQLASELASDLPKRQENATDPSLARVVAAWPQLPPHVKEAILALVRGS